MWASQLWIEFDTVYRHPGLTVEGIIEKIGEEHGDTKAARNLLLKSRSWIEGDLRGFNCIEERNGLYYFIPVKTPYSYDYHRDDTVKSYIAEKLLKVEKHLKKKLDGD